MWAQQWNNIYDIVEPYKDQPAIDVTPELQKKVRCYKYKRQRGITYELISGTNIGKIFSDIHL